MKKKHNILLYIETSGPGGAETVLLDIARNVDRNQFNPIVVIHKSKWLHKQLLEHNIDTKIITSNRAWDLSFLVKLVKYSRQFKIDLIHSHLFGANLYSCLAGLILKIPVITTFHNELFLAGGSERYISLKNLLIRKLSSKMVFVADYMKRDYLNTAKYSPKKMLTIYNGIDLDKLNTDADISDFRKELGLQDNDLLVGHVANLRPPKGHRYLIETAGKVCKIFPKIKFLLIGEEGDGKIKREIEELIAELGLNENIKLLGFREDVHRLLHLIDIFVLSSISEGLPLSVVEAMAASKPIVATDVGGLSEIVVNDRNGYLVKAKNPSALAEKISVLIKNKELRIDMGKAGRKIVEEKFSLKTMIDNYQNLYEKLIK